MQRLTFPFPFVHHESHPLAQPYGRLSLDSSSIHLAANHSQPVAASQGTSNIPGFYSHNVTARHGKEREIAWRVETWIRMNVIRRNRQTMIDTRSLRIACLCVNPLSVPCSHPAAAISSSCCSSYWMRCNPQCPSLETSSSGNSLEETCRLKPRRTHLKRRSKNPRISLQLMDEG